MGDACFSVFSSPTSLGVERSSNGASSFELCADVASGGAVNVAVAFAVTEEAVAGKLDATRDAFAALLGSVIRKKSSGTGSSPDSHRCSHS